MSTELQQTDVMDADIVCAEMIEDAVANCFVTIDDAPERALELVTPEEIAAVEDADHYVTERSFDGYMLQTLESKARFISQIMAGEVTARTAEDVGDMVLTVAAVTATLRPRSRITTNEMQSVRPHSLSPCRR